MSSSSRQQLTQQTRLQQRLNPQQLALGRLLEMNAPEIEEEVRRQLDDNPALTQVDDTPETADDTFNESAEQLQLADYRTDDDIPSYRLEASNGPSPEPAFERVAASDGESLIDTLMSQLVEYSLTPAQTEIARFIIGNLDSNGYLTRSADDIADDMAVAGVFAPTPAQVAEVVEIVRHLDPAGIAATDLRDCLLLQLDRMPASLNARIAHEIIAAHFDLFAKKHADRLRAVLGISADALNSAIDLIRSLNPKPGSLLETSGSADKLSYIVPDFSVDIDHDGRVSIALLSRTPELAIEESFCIDTDNIPANRRHDDAATFIRRKHDDAAAFINTLSMRNNTLMSVMRAIVTLQRDFFISNDRADIHPMILKDVQALTGLDLSVISRAATGKYVITPLGIYPLKMFFNERPTDDADTSSHEILEHLRQIIAGEDKKHPLSDEALTRLLADAGYDIARRTVAKYRERLGLPVARLRKQF